MNIPAEQWKWFGHAGHLIVARWCRFHLCTLVGKHIVSTVGEYWPERSSREIHAQVYDPAWLAENRSLKGDNFDAAYMERFGYEEIGYERKYETMVFPWGGEVCTADGCNCGMPMPSDWSGLEMRGYNTAGDAAHGHVELCQQYAEGGN